MTPSEPSSPKPPPPKPPPGSGNQRPGAEADQAWRAFAYLLAGPLLYGGIGLLLDRWWGTSFLLPVGIVAGMGLSLYLIWFRYGTH
jgi:hypothetical protein